MNKVKKISPQERLRSYIYTDKNTVGGNAVCKILAGDLRDFSKKEISTRFELMARALMNKCVIKVGVKKYRITELEFYYFNEVNHIDLYAHKHKMQQEFAKWYVHGSGVDITFGDNGAFGGILIRGIQNVTTESFISGPLNVLNTFLSDIENTDDKLNSLVLEYNDIHEEAIYKSSRYGLKKKDVDSDDFFSKRYRYISHISSRHHFKEKTIVAKNIAEDLVLSKDEIEAMFWRNIL
ncbi:MAG: hypothetical protein WBG43_04405 [Marinifilaceae bacterium]